MLLFENIILALRGLSVNKMRAFLTMLGIIIGIGSVIAIMTVGNSMTNSVASSLQSMGANNVTLSLTEKSSTDSSQNKATRMFMPSTYKDKDLITDSMISEFRKAYASDIYAIGLSESVGNFDIDISGSTQTAPITATGTDSDYQKVKSLEIINGRFLNDTDNGKKVAVVSSVFADALFPHQDAIEKTFTFTNKGTIYTFYIIGVYEYKSTGSTQSTTDSIATSAMYMPMDTAKKITKSASGYSSLTVVGAAGTDTTSFLTRAQYFFADYYTHNDSYTVTASSMQSMVDTMTSTLSSISLAISIIAGISLLVGGIGVMNIMLVSITERTREIGTRKALGASNASIRLQFIVEAIIICLIGGIIGVALGVTLGAIGAQTLGYAASPSIAVILLAVSFSMVIGVFFGYYPANKAAKLDPVEALRYE